MTADCHWSPLAEQVGDGSGQARPQGSPGRLLAVTAGGLDGAGSSAETVDIRAPDADPTALAQEQARERTAGSVPGGLQTDGSLA